MSEYCTYIKDFGIVLVKVTRDFDSESKMATPPVRWYLLVHLAISRGKRRQSRESKFNQKLPRLKPLRGSGVRRAPQILLFFLKALLSKAFVKTREERNKFILNMRQRIFLIFAFLARQLHSDSVLYDFEESNILLVVEDTCLFVGKQPVNPRLRDVLEQLSNVFSEENGVEVGTLDVANFRWPSGTSLQWKYSDVFHNLQGDSAEVAFFRRKEIDRTCLMKPKHVVYPFAEAYGGPFTLEAMVPFVNSVCGTFRAINGRISSAGEEKARIFQNLFHVQSLSESNMGSIYNSTVNPLNQSYVWHKEPDVGLETCDIKAEYCSRKSKSTHKEPTTMASCEVVDHDITRAEFLETYLKRSKPVIFKKSIMHWPAFKKWTNEFFKTRHGERRVHIKLTPTGDFEGVEKAELWDDYKVFKIPEQVLQQLPYPDLVVVRPAYADMLMSDFINLINETSSQTRKNISAYLEYSSIRDIVEDLEKDVIEPEFMKHLLNLKHMNIWLSDGDTLGRLHFDPFDNLLCQVRKSE